MPATGKNCSPPRRFASIALRTSQIAPVRTSASRRVFLKRSAGVLLVSGIGSSLLSACGGSLDAGQPETPRLASVDNFRDVAGAAAGYPTVDGKQMRRGVFYRANALTFSAADEAAIDHLGIAAVYDLRTPGEAARIADTLPAGATSEAFNVLGARDFVAPSFDTAAAATAFMEAQARAYVTGAAQRASYGALLTRLAEGAEIQLFHSSAGKDRAGWVAALLQSIANVPLDVIMQDYLLSNVYSALSIRAHTDMLRTRVGAAAAASEAPLFDVQESYLQAGFDQVQASYGTMASYLTQGLGVSQATIDRLRARLVV
ncbi:tyrosine-protein phosphatase [Paraburkholderia terricola]|jgi:protein-tyrosine phosphatase|uniref:Protein-tyrosine phosphatase n=1 Tax=Paraburkholderia terricola TaxID=169427 RepID=A0A1M6W7V1_9BURK|nr:MULTISPECIES: tyrosine-protein phosphatase [Paraburkholderia]ORC45023.1 protein-tyrosine-phosphatase [Burkholderia sp. A27]SDP15804.1 protein-tyrosine phosphatase [Paraburkholderia sediminicola]SHK89718.1 protein-tyrosine phosphatase [Paraburkholderia terricola]